MTTTQQAVDTTVSQNADIISVLENLRTIMIADYFKFSKEGDFNVSFEIGTKYIRVVIESYGSRSCGGFVVNIHDHKKFAFGDLLKCATWSAPAVNKARGNVFDLDGKSVPWTGIK